MTAIQRPELAVGARHHGEHAVLERQAFARPVVDGSARQPQEGRLDGGERVSSRQ